MGRKKFINSYIILWRYVMNKLLSYLDPEEDEEDWEEDEDDDDDEDEE